MARRRSRPELEAEIPRLRRLARLLVRGDAAEADDLVQETLLRALRAADGLRERDALGAWLVSILVNLHRSRNRQSARRRELMEAYGPRPGVEPSEGPRQETRLEAKETLAALGTLPEDQRMAVATVSVGGLGYAEAAQALGLKLGTLMSRVSRGRAALRARLEGAAVDHEDDGRCTPIRRRA